MSRVRGFAAAGAAFACALLLQGCVPGEPHHKPTPTAIASVAPVFASEAEALAAARKAYEGYSKAADLVGLEGGANPQRLSNWLTPEWLEVETKSFEEFAKSGLHLEGITKYTHFELERFSDSGGSVEMSIYVCSDLTSTKLRDRANKDVTPSDRALILPLEVGFINRAKESSELVITRSESWTGVCCMVR